MSLRSRSDISKQIAIALMLIAAVGYMFTGESDAPPLMHIDSGQVPAAAAVSLASSVSVPDSVNLDWVFDGLSGATKDAPEVQPLTGAYVRNKRLDDQYLFRKYNFARPEIVRR